MKVLLGILLVISLSFIGCAKRQNKTDNLLGSDIKLFKEVAWGLAQAVAIEDTVKMKKILRRGKVKVDVREGKFGMTLLIWAMSEKKYHSAEILLRYGSNPNLQDYNDGKTSAIIVAANNFESSEFLKLALRYGGDPNNEIVSNVRVLNQTPLVAAAMTNLENVKLLIEAGAEIDKGVEKKQSALFAAVRAEQVKIVKYLLIDKNAEFSLPVSSKEDGRESYIVDFMRGWVYPLDSDKYKIKMEIVEYLKANGMDYWKTEIPKRYYKQYSSEYLKKY